MCRKQPLISAQVVIGTPGTIEKWMANRKLGMTQIKILVFDEADHMLAKVDFILPILFGKKYNLALQTIIISLDGSPNYQGLHTGPPNY
jgi:ERCC4-related helicase